MNERFHKWTAWLVCAALITICGTSVAFAAPVDPAGQELGTSHAIVLPREEEQEPGSSSTPSLPPSSTPDPPSSSSEPSSEGNSGNPSSSSSQAPDPDPPTDNNPGGTPPPTQSDPPAETTGNPTTSGNKNPNSTAATSSKKTSGNTKPVSSTGQETSSEFSWEESSAEEPPSTISLPDVDSMDLSVPQMLGSGVEETTQNNTLLGILAWVLIGVGIIIVLIVLFTSAKSGAKKSVGRKRYHRGTYKSKRKHLLDDKYYRKNKYK